jgi:hypothetical protein
MRPSRAIYSKHWETPFSLFSEVVLVEIGIVAIDFDHLRNEAPAWSPFELHDNAKQISGVGLDRSAGQVNSALENATGESCEGLLGRCRMNGRETSRMTRVEELQEIVRRVADYRSADKRDPESYARRTVTKAQAEFNHKFVKADGNAGQVSESARLRPRRCRDFYA